VAVVLQLLLGTLLATLGIALPVPAPTQAYCDASYGRPVGEVFTWEGFTFQKYLGDAACETHRQGSYDESNVAVDAAGDLVVSARRDGSTYSVGRVRMTVPQVPASDFEWGFEAQLPATSVPGARAALWLVNLDQIYCDPLWGELDVMEWYSAQPDRAHAATHATCTDASYTSWHHKPDTSGWASSPGGFHTYAVRKTTANGVVTMSYLYDGTVYATDTCTDQLPADTCRAVFDRAWSAILQTAVFADDSGPFTKPDADVDFPDLSLVVRDMWVKRL
jgi:hypothetical protein